MNTKSLLLAACLVCCDCVAAQSQPALDMTAALTDGTAYYRLFSAAEPVDFSATDGVDAYVVTRKRMAYGATQTVTLTRVDRVPALTGVLVRTAEARPYTLATATGDVSAPAKNALVAVSQTTDAADLFVTSSENGLVIDQSPALLTVADDGHVGFQKVELAKGLEKQADGHYTYAFARDSIVLDAGTAYLPIDAEAGEMVAAADVVPLVLLDEPEPLPSADNIADTKSFIDQAEEANDFVVTFHDAVVTAVTPGEQGQGDNVVVQDQTAAIRLFSTGLASRLSVGDVLNGSLQLYLDYSPYGSALIGGDETEATFAQLTIAHGDAPVPTLINDDNIEDYVNDYDWRLVRFTGENVFSLSDSDEPYLFIDIIGDEVGVFDILQTSIDYPAVGTKVEVVGFLFSLFGDYYLQPLTFTPVGESTAVRHPLSTVRHPQSSTTYDLLGRRLDAKTAKGLVVRDGRKLLVK